MMKLFLQIFAAFFASALLMQTAAYSYRRSNELPSEDVCRRNDICRWAICPWTRQLYAPSEDCQYLEGCHCPSYLTCQRMLVQIPRAGFNIFQFRCK